VSLLRFRHKLDVVVRQLTHCDYIVSNRMAVDRRSYSGHYTPCCCVMLRISMLGFPRWNCLSSSIAAYWIEEQPLKDRVLLFVEWKCFQRLFCCLHFNNGRCFGPGYLS